jgi:cation transport regulator ChaC
VILHFAYGSNMSRLIMRRHAPHAQPLGVAALAGYRFLITVDGYASVEPKHGSNVYGVLWRLMPSDRKTLDSWENVAGGLYRPKFLPVRRGERRRIALTYVAKPGPGGFAKAGYMELVIAAALEWRLPRAYTHSLRRWLPRRAGAKPRAIEDFQWT